MALSLTLYCTSIYIWLIWRGKKKSTKATKPQKPHNKDPLVLVRTSVHYDFIVFQPALLLGMIYRFISCCLASVHHQDQGFQANWILLVCNIFRQQFPGGLFFFFVQVPISLNIAQVLLKCIICPTKRRYFFHQFVQLFSPLCGEYYA